MARHDGYGFEPLEGGGYRVAAPPPAQGSPAAWWPNCFNPCNLWPREKSRGGLALPDGFPPAPRGFHRYTDESIDEGLQVERYLGDVRPLGPCYLAATRCTLVPGRGASSGELDSHCECYSTLTNIPAQISPRVVAV
jgi:hypothetical protein